ncbi:MAG: transposase [Acidobacteriota bacterium]
MANYLIKYVVSPPMAVRRIIEYDGQEVEYYWQDHRSKKQESARVSAVEFIRRLVQHILPKGFQRVRYFGLQAVWKAIGATIQLAFCFAETIMEKLGWRAKIKAKFGRDPIKCDHCGSEMLLWKVWTPTHGTVFYLPDDAPEWFEAKPSAKLEEVAQLSFAF